ncbi:MAG: amidohydrolase [Ruminococcus sp.]|nr:amidohydrolase [Ruminococcus sp.]
MRYFDFHTHAFADSLASRAMASLSGTAQSSEDENIAGIHPCTDGTLGGLKKLMAARNISEAMILPIATKPTQQTAINGWAAEVTGGGIHCCGSVHPDAGDALEELERISRLGLPGIKFHPEYQYFRPDEERMFPIYKKAAELGLFVVFHGGWDPFGGEEILARPVCFARIAERVPELTLIAAHMGGMKLFDEAEELLAGKYPNIYLDTGMAADFISPEQLLRMIGKHGADRILFASDAPWDDPGKEIAMIEALPLTEEEKELIFFRNAERILMK